MGRLVDRTHRELTDEELKRIADTYHKWRTQEWTDADDIPGFCKSASHAEVEGHNFVLTPGRYVGAEAAEEDDEPFDQKMQRLVAQLAEQQVEAAKLDQTINENLRGLGYDI